MDWKHLRSGLALAVAVLATLGCHAQEATVGQGAPEPVAAPEAPAPAAVPEAPEPAVVPETPEPTVASEAQKPVVAPETPEEPVVDEADATSAPPAPSLVCDKPVYEFGERDNSEVVEHDFIIRNDGDLTLEIKKAKPSCGCTVANISLREVPPGESAVITAKLNLKGRDGKQHKTISVESNDPVQPNYKLTLTGTAIASITVSPRSIIVPNIEAGVPRTNIVRVTSRDPEPLTITDIKTGHEKVTATVVPVEGENAVEIHVVTAADLPRGSTFGRLTAKTGNPNKPLINIPFRYTVLGEIAVYPQEITMISQTQAVTRILTLGPGKIKAFTVEGVDLPDESMTAKIQDLKNSRYRVVLSNIQPTMELNGKSITIHTTAAGMESVSIPFKVIQRR